MVFHQAEMLKVGWGESWNKSSDDILVFSEEYQADCDWVI